jgi:hypothetical protein
MMEAMRSSETSVLTRATWRNIKEDGILHCHCRENLNLVSIYFNQIKTLLMFEATVHKFFFTA